VLNTALLLIPLSSYHNHSRGHACSFRSLCSPSLLSVQSASLCRIIRFLIDSVIVHFICRYRQCFAYSCSLCVVSRFPFFIISLQLMVIRIACCDCYAHTPLCYTTYRIVAPGRAPAAAKIINRGPDERAHIRTPARYLFFRVMSATEVHCQSTSCLNGNPSSRLECPTCHK
jgi:hypothetical protein